MEQGRDDGLLHHICMSDADDICHYYGWRMRLDRKVGELHDYPDPFWKEFDLMVFEEVALDFYVQIMRHTPVEFRNPQDNDVCPLICLNLNFDMQKQTGRLARLGHGKTQRR